MDAAPSNAGDSVAVSDDTPLRATAARSRHLVDLCLLMGPLDEYIGVGCLCYARANGTRLFCAGLCPGALAALPSLVFLA